MKRSHFYVPLVLAGALAAIYYLVTIVPVPVPGHGDIREILFGKAYRYLFFLLILSLIVFAVRIVDFLFFDLIFSKRTTLHAPALLREIVSIALYFLLIGAAVSTILNFSITSILATGTVVAAIIGLALQDTLGNLFSGISLHMERTFDTGDVIRAGDMIGVVEGISWRAVKIRTFNNNLVVLPNAVLARERLEVFPSQNLNARLVTVHVAYDVPPATVISILRQAASHVDGVSRDIPCIARVGSFGDSGIIYEVKYWTTVYHMRDTIDADIRHAVWYALRRNQIIIPYPIRSVQVMPERSKDMLATEQEIAERLKGVEVLSPLSDDERSSIASSLRVRRYGRGETILEQGDHSDSMFVIHRGEVSIRVREHHLDQEVATLGPGSVFGEMALLTGEARAAHVIALSEAIVLEIRKESLQPILVENPDLATMMSRKIVERKVDLVSRRTSPEEEHQTIVRRVRSYFNL